MEKPWTFSKKKNYIYPCFFEPDIDLLWGISGDPVSSGRRHSVFSGSSALDFSNLIPDETAMERLPKILDKLVETALLSVAVTVLAGICAFFFSLLGSGITKIHWSINRLVRIVAAFFRNVPDVVWAMLLMFSFGQNILTGFLHCFLPHLVC